MIRPSLIIHGGAGDIMDAELIPCRDGLRAAIEAGWAVLEKGGCALDAVEIAINVMEDDPAFDAGRGSYPNTANEIEMDAIIIDGATLNSGAVAAIQRVSHPISVARMVMERTPHSLFVGSGAEAFARQNGVPLCPVEMLMADSKKPKNGPGDTVGAVALDSNGRIAAATSTGGTPDKMPGRVGDSPLIGCGAYADDRIGGASATGRGEDLMKVIFSKSACDYMAAGLSAHSAADRVVNQLVSRISGGQGGIITMDINGNVGFAFSTVRMNCAWVTPAGNIEYGVFTDHRRKII
jgi:beta-aspartyl-peptidase (threonine type)